MLPPQAADFDFFYLALQIRIIPDEGFYDLRELKDAKKMPLGLLQAIECNKYSELNNQLHQICLCIDTSGTEFIQL
ncbi:unnamed protein product [Brassica rapa subsp. narinosa]